MLPLGLIIFASFAAFLTSFQIPYTEGEAGVLRFGSVAVLLGAILFGAGELPFWPVAAFIALGSSFFAYVFYVQAIELKSRSTGSAAALGGFLLMAMAAAFI